MAEALRRAHKAGDGGSFAACVGLLQRGDRRAPLRQQAHCRDHVANLLSKLDLRSRAEAAVRALFENASQGNFDALDEIVAPDYVLHPEEVRGADGLTEMVEGYRNALSGLSVTIDQQFTEGDYVATRFTIRGTHDGELMGTPPTGKHVAFTGITISRCEGGPHPGGVGDHGHVRPAGPSRRSPANGPELNCQRLVGDARRAARSMPIAPQR